MMGQQAPHQNALFYDFWLEKHRVAVVIGQDVPVP